jgi:hypothetical protein
MRLRFAVLASVLTAFVAVAAPGVANAAPRHNHGLTINATPDPIVSGDAVLIYGQLNRSHPGGKIIVLWHRINPSSHFSIIGFTKTTAQGFYEFTRAEGVVLTNRSWFVTAPFLPGNVHSRTVHERAAASLSLAASSTTSDTNHAIMFTGSILPTMVHVGEHVWLQAQAGLSGDDWRTIKGGVINSNSSFTIPYRFLIPGTYELRAKFGGDDRNTMAVSDTVTVIVQQTEVPSFTINSSAPIIDEGHAATISGVLYLPPATPTSTLVPAPSVNVTLWGREDNQTFQALQHAFTGTDGSYSFTVMPQHNTVYQVRTTFAPPAIRHSALLFEGVRDVVTLAASSPTSVVGQSVTFTGTVTPDKAGHVIELQKLGKDGDYHTVALGFVNGSSAYKFVWKFGYPASHTFRTLVPGGPENASGHSSPVAVTVTLPPVPALPTT